jgi:thioredoxin reductase
MTTGALQRFVYINGVLPCRRPIVVGTEYISLSTLLTLRHGGVKPVAMVAEQGSPTAPRPFVAAARMAFGTPVLHGTLSSIEGAKQVERVIVATGGERRIICCDAVIFTGHWIPENTLVRMHPVGIDMATDGPPVDQNLRTADPALYAAGNVRFAVRSSGRCALEGRRAARAIASDLAVTGAFLE